ncbi:MAG: nucleotidyltransferase family protein, partial [Pseudomonadota bacterium]|nr:nucleotidyltransferase family protein [Pseudomonadota bacterium]
SIRIAHPRLFDGCPEGAFSFLQLMDKAEAEGRLRAVIHKGDWHHISTPEELERVDKALTESRNVA